MSRDKSRGKNVMKRTAVSPMEIQMGRPDLMNPRTTGGAKQLTHLVAEAGRTRGSVEAM